MKSSNKALGASGGVTYQSYHLHLLGAATSILFFRHAPLFADERLINFDNTTIAAQASQYSETHKLPGAMGRELNGLVRNAQNAVKQVIFIQVGALA